MIHPICPTCKQQSMIEIDQLAGGLVIMACLYCDLPQEEDGFYIYQNHCWNCWYEIDSRFCNPSPIPDMGYVCNHCGKDLTEWKLRNGLITASQLYNLQSGGHYGTVVLRPLWNEARV